MEFIESCGEMAALVKEAIGELAGTPASGDYMGMGADGTPTKRIDRVAEDAIIEYLKREALCERMISEERGIVPIGGAEGTIFVDPVDGTHNAIKGIPFYAISIGLVKSGETMAGYVEDLASGDRFSAVKGEGAYLNGSPVRISRTSLLEESTMSVYGRKFNPATVLRLGQKIRRWRLLGASALELCYVSCGRLDGFIDVRGTLRVTDAIAGILICEEAGGTVSDHKGRPLRFPEEVTVGKCLVATNGSIHGKVIQYLQE